MLAVATSYCSWLARRTLLRGYFLVPDPEPTTEPLTTTTVQTTQTTHPATTITSVTTLQTTQPGTAVVSTETSTQGEETTSTVQTTQTIQPLTKNMGTATSAMPTTPQQATVLPTGQQGKT